jgi:hypothetical protein
VGAGELGSMEVKPVVATVGRPMALTPNVPSAPGIKADNDRLLDFTNPAHARTMQRLLKDGSLRWPDRWDLGTEITSGIEGV